MDLLEPLHSERHRSAILTRTVNLIAWLLITFAFLVGGRSTDGWVDAWPLLVIGLGLAGTHWFLAPRRYNIFEEHLVITYGKPRQRIISFDEMSDINIVRHPLGAELRIQRTNGRPVTIQPWNPRRFHEQLEEALNKFRGIEQKYQFPEAPPSEA